MSATKRCICLTLFIAGAGCAPGPQDEPGHSDVEQVEQKVVIPGATSYQFAQPGGSYFKGVPHVSYIGTDRRVNVIRQVAGGGWSAPTIIEETGLWGASLYPNLSQLYLVYFNGYQNFVSMRSFDSYTWDERREYSVVAQDGSEVVVGAPALVVHGNLLQAYFAIAPSNPTAEQWRIHGRIVQLVRHYDGNWYNYGSWPAVTDDGPSAALLGNKLVVAWNSVGPGFHTRVYNPDFGWGNISTNYRNQHGQLFPALTNDGQSTLLWVYREETGANTNRISFDKTTDGWNFDFFKSTNHTSERRPFGIFAGQWDNKIEWSHVGTDPARSVNFTSIPF